MQSEPHTIASAATRRAAPESQAPCASLELEDDRLREECGVFGIFGHPDAATIVALGLHDQSFVLDELVESG